MEYRISVSPRESFDSRAADLLSQISHLGISAARQAHVSALYFVRGSLSPAALERLTDELLVDPIVETCRWEPVDSSPPPDDALAIEVGLRPGVTDPVASI